MARTAFVTGAAGFLGRHLVEELERQGWEITAFCRATDRTDLLSSTVRIEIGDLTDADRVREALPDHVDAIFHLAGNTTTWSRNAAAQFRDNVDGTAHVIEAALAKHAAAPDLHIIDLGIWLPARRPDRRAHHIERADPRR